MTRTGMVFSDFIASTLLTFLIYVLKDDANLGAGPPTPLGLFFVIFGIGLAGPGRLATPSISLGTLALD